MDRYNLEESDNKITSVLDSSSSSINAQQRHVISWDVGDRENPYNFSSVSQSISVSSHLELTHFLTRGEKYP